MDYIFVNQNYFVPSAFLYPVTGLTAIFGVPVADLLAWQNGVRCASY